MLKQPDGTYAGYRRAGIRLSEELVPALQPHRTERLLQTLSGIHAFDKAHAVMLIETGLISAADGRLILAALRDMEREGVETARLRVQGGAHSGEQYLIRALGENIGGRIHLGRSSGDVGEVARRTTSRAHLLRIMDAINILRRTFLTHAHDHLRTIMPGYTHGQHAQVTTLGHWASMWDRVLARDVARCLDLFARNNQSPAGAAIMTGTDFPIDRERTALLLGFERASPHTMDAVLSVDNTVEFACVVALIASDQSRLADDIISWSSAEIAFFEIPDRFCGTSSIMMQKKNPVWPEAAKGVGAQCIGALTEIFSSVKGATGLTLHERSIAEGRLWEASSALIARLGEASDLVANLSVDADRMAALASIRWGTATDLAGAIVREAGLPWRSAHQIIGIVVRWCEERHAGPDAVNSELVDRAALEYFGERIGLSEDVVRAALDPRELVARRTLLGGPAPETHAAQLPAFEAELAADEVKVAQLYEQLAASERELERSIGALMNAQEEPVRGPAPDQATSTSQRPADRG